MKFTDDQISDIADEKLQENQERNDMYSVLDKVFWESRFTGELDKAIDSESRRSKGDRLLLNYVKARVRDKISLLTMLPDIKVDDLVEEEEDALFWSDFLSKIIKSKWEENQMPNKFRTFSHDLSLKGLTGVLLYPQFKEKKIKWYSTDPANIYGEFKLGSDSEYSFIMLISKPMGRQIIEMYPQLANHPDVPFTKEPVELIQYFDETHMKVYVARKPVPGVGVEHGLGFIPFRAIPNVQRTARFDGLSDVYQEIILGENMNDIMAIATEELREHVGGLMMIRDGKNLPEKIPTGRRAYVEVEATGDIEYKTRVQNPAEVTSYLSMLDGFFRVGTNWPSQRSGVIPSAIWTQKGIVASQSSVSDEAQQTKEAIGTELVRLNEMHLKMEKKLFGRSKQTAIGLVKNQAFKFEYTPNEDIPDEFRHNLVFFPLGHDIPTMIVNLMQLKMAGVIDLRSVLERLPGINPNEVLKRLKEDRSREMRWQAEAAMLAQSLQGGGPQEQQTTTPEVMERLKQSLENGAVSVPEVPAGSPEQRLRAERQPLRLE